MVSPASALSPLAALAAGGSLVTTAAGGAFALRQKRRLPLLMGFTSGVLLALVGFDLLPEIARRTAAGGIGFGEAAAGLILAALLLHSGEHALFGADTSGRGERPRLGALSALAMTGHSFMDGVGIGVGFAVSRAVGIVVAIAIVSHDFIDGINVVSMTLGHGVAPRRSAAFLALDAVAPLLGWASTLLLRPSPAFVAVFLSLAAAFLLYIASRYLLRAGRHGAAALALSACGFLCAWIGSAVVG